MLCLTPLLSCNLSAAWDPLVNSTDASNHRVGASECLLPDPEIAQELSRHSCFKGARKGIRLYIHMWILLADPVFIWLTPTPATLCGSSHNQGS